jgi:hypothetical protein
MRSLTEQRVVRDLGWIGAACWLASWFLPSIEDYPGWKAFLEILEGPFRDRFPVRGEDAAVHLMSVFTNGVFVLQFAWWKLGKVARWTLYLKIAIACLLINLYWLVQLLRAGEAEQLLIGYYAWLLGFAALVAVGALNVVSARRTSRTPTGDTPA